MQIITLANPLACLTEGTRAALTPQIPHMAATAIVGVLTALAVMLTVTGGILLRKRVQS